MKPSTATRIAQAIQLLKLDDFKNYTNRQLADISGINQKTISKNKDLINIFDFAINRGDYKKCVIKKVV